MTPLTHLTLAGRSAAALVITYTVGIVGLSIEATRELFITLTPVQLLLTLTLLLANQRPRPWPRSATVAAVGVFALGYGVEALGVNTGLIFGEYHYGEALGPRLLNTPLMIGVNWLILVWAAVSVAHRAGLSGAGLAATVATGLVLLDALIEPVAVALGFWQWVGGVVPLQNYVGWWVTALVLSWGSDRLSPSATNPIGGVVLFCQVMFFGTLNLLYLALNA